MNVGDIRQVVEDAYQHFGDINYIDSLPVYVHVKLPKSIDQVMREAAGESEDTQEVAYTVRAAEVLPDETFVIHLGEPL